MGFDALQLWGSGRPLSLVMEAQRTAISAEHCFLICKLAQEEELYRYIQEKVSPEDWLKFYLQEKQTIGQAWEAYESTQKWPKKLEDAGDEAYKLWTAKKGKFIVGKKENREVESQYFRLLEEWHYKELTKTLPPASTKRFFRAHPAAAFMFRVVLPCIFLWHRSPARLFQEARAGNPSSLGKLLRLDPVIMEDERIRKRQVAILRKADGSAEALLAEQRKDTSRLITIENMKSLLGGLVILQSKETERFLKDMASKSPGMKVGGVRLREPDIRDLYNAVWIDLGGEGEDPDIAESSEAFSKSLQRAQKFWNKT